MVTQIRKRQSTFFKSHKNGTTGVCSDNGKVERKVRHGKINRDGAEWLCIMPWRNIYFTSEIIDYTLVLRM